MTERQTMLLLGVGGAGSAAARRICASFPGEIECRTIDTDAGTGRDDPDFILMGGERLSGRGSGGNIVHARLAAEESVGALDGCLSNVRLAVIVAALGGGTGGGATLEIARHLRQNGITSVVFATEPFSFEGQARQTNVQSVASMIEEEAGSCFFIPLDLLVSGEDNMVKALDTAIERLASAVTLFWRLAAKPGFIKLDTERLRHAVSRGGRGRFAAFAASGPDRAKAICDAIGSSAFLAKPDDSPGPRTVLCGVLAGDDLRLTEIGAIADAVQSAGGREAAFELATVNDEESFSGTVRTVVMMLDGKPDAAVQPSTSTSAIGNPRAKAKSRNPLSPAPQGRGRFNNAEPTVHNGEDLDIPTFIRRNINLDF